MCGVLWLGTVGEDRRVCGSHARVIVLAFFPFSKADDDCRMLLSQQGDTTHKPVLYCYCIPLERHVICLKRL